MNKIFIFCALAVLVCSKVSAQLNLSWQQIGPVNFGGPVFSLLIDKRDSARKTVYAGVFGGGIWKSTNGGDWWTALDCIENNAVSCMTQDAIGNIYFGTGGLISNSYITPTSLDLNQRGNGIYRLDGMDNITHLSSTIDTGTTSPWSQVNRIAVNPINSSQIIAATSNGLYWSTDAGISWAPASLPQNLIGQASSDVKWGNDGATIFAAVGRNSISTGTRLVRSLDGGQKWELIRSGNFTGSDTFPGFPNVQGRIEIALAPSNANVVYISIATPIGATYSVFRSLDKGNSWTQILAKSASFDPFSTINLGWFDNAISVSPADSSVIYIGGVNMYSYSPATGPNLISQLNHPEISATHQVEHFMFEINDHDPDEMYIATLYGVFKSANAYSNLTSPNIMMKNAGLCARDFYTVTAHRAGNVMGGSGKGLLMNDGKSNLFQFVFKQNSAYCEFSHLDTNFIIVGATFSAPLRRYNTGNSWLDFSDSILNKCASNYIGSTAPFRLFETKKAWNTSDSITFISSVNYSAGDTILVQSKTAQTYFPFKINTPLSAGNAIKIPDAVKARLFFGTNCGIFLTNDALNTITPVRWFRISSQSSIQYMDASFDGNTVYACNSQGQVIRYTGLNFINYDSIYGTYNPIISSANTYISTVDAGRLIEGIAVDPKNDSVVIVTISGTFPVTKPNAYKTTNGGITWTPMQIGPLGLPVFTCLIDMQNSNVYFAGTEQGIWTSTDAGATWFQDNSDVCDVSVKRLRQIPLFRDDCPVLYAATASQGLWRSFSLTPAGCDISIDLNEIPDQHYSSDAKIYPNPSSDGVFTLSISPVWRNSTVNIFDIQGKKVHQLLMSNDQTSFSLNHLPDAVYFLRMVKNGQEMSLKLVKL